ncbi:MAG: type VI-B CRISPR-associated RNA-guided ribonuclease Cas13b [Odoribacteraceae bacterium]|jgi:hypothetical protein|nr:type VI-B CRISPR-associated RNA-guided ribonuclease Cas13b [Odoribacteraceae bacterium]
MTAEEKKSLFAAYLNMARQNAYITLLHISKLTGGGSGNEDDLSQMAPVQRLINPTALPEEIEQTIRLMNKHFPFLKPMRDQEKKRQTATNTDQAMLYATPRMYYDILTKVFSELNSQRNQQTHVRHTSEPFNRELISYMKNCFDGAVRTVKERFRLQDKDTAHLNRFKEKPGDEYNGQGKKKKEYEENPAFHYKFDDSTGNITDNGLAFFICLFLERKYAHLLLSQLAGFKRSGQKGVEESTRATKTVFSIYNIRVPALRIDSEHSAMTLGIDMLNELKRCPAELFEHLDAETQEHFRVIPDETESGEEVEPTLLKRHENRFPQLALQYIDQRELFPNIRFQVALGSYRHTFYAKQGIDQKERVRILQKRLHGFGRLQEIEKLRKQEWEKLIRPFENIEKDRIDTSPYITDAYTRYMISNNRVGLYWDIGTFKNTGDRLPELKDDGATNQAPVCWLSIYELPALVFHSLLCEKKEKTQNIIRKYVQQNRKLFCDLAAGQLLPSPDVRQTIKRQYAIEFSHLPDELRDYLSGKPKNMEGRFAQLAKVRISRMTASTQGRKRKIEKDLETIRDHKKNKVGKRRYVEIKSGVLADFLAEDLLRFQPTGEKEKKKGSDKLTGMNYQALQAVLAYYGEYKTEMRRIFVSSRLLDSPIAHPFLEKVMKTTPDDIVAFYRAYLEEREKYLNTCLQEQEYKHYYFLHADRDKWQQRDRDYYEKLAKKYLALPIELPRGLFNESIRQLLNKFHGDAPGIKDALSRERCNTVYLIQTYFNAVLDDGKQALYDFSRGYKLFDVLNDKVRGNKLQQTFYTTADFEQRTKNISEEINRYIGNQYQKEKRRLQGKRLFRDLKQLEAEKDTQATHIRDKLTRLWNEFEHNEKILRLTRVQDMLLFLMAKRLLIDGQLTGTEINIEEYKLKNITPGNQQDILSIQTPLRLSITLPDGSRRTIRQAQLKLKNFGKLYRLVHDKRVKTVLSYFPDEEVDYQTLEKELEAYDRLRVYAFKLIHRFENRVIKEKEIQGTYLNFVNILQHCPGMERNDKQQLQIIRNAFCHNSYPARKENICDVESNERIDVEFCLDEAIPNVAHGLLERVEKLIEKKI